MDIEITVRTGKRIADIPGEWRWVSESRHIVTYEQDPKGAIREALWQTERMLREDLGMRELNDTIGRGADEPTLGHKKMVVRINDAGNAENPVDVQYVVGR